MYLYIFNDLLRLRSDYNNFYEKQILMSLTSNCLSIMLQQKAKDIPLMPKR